MRLLFSLILQVCFFAAVPQRNQLHFDHIGTTEGLSHNNILCIMQDQRGFMWFGSWEGLNKYDGYKITVYKNDRRDTNSISNNYINGMSKSSNGDLWVATNNGGLCRYNRKKENFTRYKHDPRNTNSISSDVTNCVLEDEEEKVWIGTPVGLDMFDRRTNRFYHFTNNPADKTSLSDSYIKSIYEDSYHNIWVGTISGGLNVFNRDHNSFRRFEHDPKDTNTIGGSDIYAIFEDHQHRLWIGTNGNGLDLFDKNRGKFIHFKHSENNANSLPANGVLAINEDADRNLWVSTENGGVSVFNYKAGLFTNYKSDEIDKESISNNSIYAVYRDTKNNMWLGNYAGGVDLANRDKLLFTHYKRSMQNNSLSNNHVMSIMEDSKKNIWIGTDGGGLNLFNPAKNIFTHYRHQKNNEQSICGDYILSSCEDSEGNIWMGAWEKGITVINPHKNTFKHYKHDPANPASLINNNSWKIFEDRDKNIWIGTLGGGLDLLNPDKTTFTHFQYNANNKDGISGSNVVNIFEDSDGNLWLCTDNAGLNLFNKKTKTFTHYLHDDTKNSISNNNLNSIWEDESNNLWISTMTGLNVFNKKTGLFKNYTVPDGLPGEYSNGVLEDSKKNLWISTNNGISRFDRGTGKFTNFSKSDGLQSNEFKQLAFCKAADGTMYFGGINGFNQFLPDSINTIAFEPPLVLTSFQVFNTEVPIEINSSSPSPLKNSITEAESVTIPYSSSVFSFEFASLNYTSNEKKQYAYMLEGFDKGWNKGGTNHVATYTNLDPGKYIFKVKGFNNQGNWSPNILSIELIISPPFWLTWWFKTAVLLGVLGCAIVFYKVRVKNVQKQKILLEKKVKQQTIELVQLNEEERKARLEAEQSKAESDLARKEATISNRTLQIKNKELEQFAYVASHDLQEPLRTTSSFVELLQKQYSGKLDEKADKYLGFISDASQRMKILIRDLLEFSRIGARAELEIVDCRLILKNVLADILVARMESGAEIHSTELPVIHGYSTEIKILFQNLLINAIKFRRAGVAPKINITTLKREGFWEFAIGDNGIGIEKQYSDRIFDIFQRLHTRTEYEGSGIGLSHCKKIVELHHGKIWVESEPGKGSIFYFTIPEKI